MINRSLDEIHEEIVGVHAIMRPCGQAVYYRTIDEIQEEARRFMTVCHPSESIPVSVEEIAEFDLGLAITPVRGLRQRFGIDGSLSFDLSEILVDEWLMERRQARYRFTLAHEIAHVVMHACFLNGLSIESGEDWKQAIRLAGGKPHMRMEFQANEFAGCLLVPSNSLRMALADALTYAQRRNLDIGALQDYGFKHLAAWIAPRFGVSRQVIEVRLIRDGLWPLCV